MHYNYKISAIAHTADAGCFRGPGRCSTCLLMTPASPSEPKTRQGKQARVMTLSGPITQHALSVFIPHHSHIILINHLPLQTVNKKYTCNRVPLNETELITCGLTVKNYYNKIKCLKMTKSMPQSTSAVNQYFNGKWFKLKLCTLITSLKLKCIISALLAS